MDKAVKQPLDRGKFQDPAWTQAGEARAQVALVRLETLWINTGTLCNLACGNCYIESSPKNDRLVYISRAEVAAYLDEIEATALGTTEIGFTGGEPFMNPDFMGMLEDALTRGFQVLVLTNAMRPMMKCAAPLLDLRERFGDRLTLRISIDHYSKRIHEAERGPRSWDPTMKGLAWLSENGFRIHVAGRLFTAESEAEVRAGFGRLFAALGAAIDQDSPSELVIFPEMDAAQDVPEITTACWDILNIAPESVMCASSRMVVKRKGDAAPLVVPCTLLPYDAQFDLGRTLGEALGSVALNHPHCAKFCVLGGASCSG